MTSEGKDLIRLCHLHRWSDFMGYGFHLEAIKGKRGHYIGVVDKDSPAFYGGLHQFDKVIEVNGHNINLENHHDVVERVKSNPKSVSLLVVNQDDEQWFTDQEIIISNSLPQVKEINCPLENPKKRDNATVVVSKTSSTEASSSSFVSINASSLNKAEQNHNKQSPQNGQPSTSASAKSGSSAPTVTTTTTTTTTTTAAPPPQPPSEPAALNLTAKEMRAQLSQKASKRREVKTESTKSFGDKASLFHQL